MLQSSLHYTQEDISSRIRPSSGQALVKGCATSHDGVANVTNTGDEFDQEDCAMTPARTLTPALLLQQGQGRDRLRGSVFHCIAQTLVVIYTPACSFHLTITVDNSRTMLYQSRRSVETGSRISRKIARDRLRASL